MIKMPIPPLVKTVVYDLQCGRSAISGQTFERGDLIEFRHTPPLEDRERDWSYADDHHLHFRPNANDPAHIEAVLLGEIDTRQRAPTLSPVRGATGDEVCEVSLPRRRCIF